MQSLNGLRVLVTGATGGIGAPLVAALAQAGAHVIAHGRSREKLDALDALGAADTCLADLTSLAEVRELAHELAPIDVLINNAGVGSGKDRLKREETGDGFELRFAVNYLAPFLLTEALLSRGAIQRAVINVASAGQAPIDLDDLQTTRHYDGGTAYCRSKLAMIMHTQDLAAAHAGLAFNSLHPGTYLDTGMVREAGIAPLGSASDGVEAILYVLGESLSGRDNGRYFHETRAAQPNTQAKDKKVTAALREKTLALIQELGL